MTEISSIGLQPEIFATTRFFAKFSQKRLKVG
jgi:hypothetical protein